MNIRIIPILKEEIEKINQFIKENEYNIDHTGVSVWCVRNEKHFIPMIDYLKENDLYSNISNSERISLDNIYNSMEINSNFAEKYFLENLGKKNFKSLTYDSMNKLPIELIEKHHGEFQRHCLSMCDLSEKFMGENIGKLNPVVISSKLLSKDFMVKYHAYLDIDTLIISNDIPDELMDMYEDYINKKKSDQYNNFLNQQQSYNNRMNNDPIDINFINRIINLSKIFDDLDEEDYKKIINRESGLEKILNENNDDNNEYDF